MAKGNGKPTVEGIIELRDALVDEARGRDALYDRLDVLYDQASNSDAAADDPDNVVIMRMPYGSNIVDMVSDLAADLKLTIEVAAESESKDKQQRADDTEKWLEALLEQNEKRRHANLTRDLAWLATQRSVPILRTLYTDELTTEDESGKLKLRSMPVLFEVIDARHVYWQEGIDGPEKVIYFTKKKLGAIRAHYGDDVLRKGGEDEKKPTDDVEWTEYWDEKYCVYLADDEPVEIDGETIIPHGFGVVPFAFGVARSTPRSEPGQRYRPLLSAVEDTLTNLDKWFSILATAGWASVTSGWNVFSDNYGANGKELDTTPGAINYFSKDDKVEAQQRAPMPPDFFKLGEMLQQALQQGTFPFAMYGQVGTGQIAGYAINMLTQSGRRPLVPIYSAVTACYEQALRNAVLICRNKVAPLVGDKVPLLIRGRTEGAGAAGRLMRKELTLDTSKIGDDFDCTVSLSDPMPQDEAANLRMAVESTKAGLLSRETALTKYKIASDAVDELDRIEIDKLYVQMAPQFMREKAAEKGYIPYPTQEPQVPPGMQPPMPGPQQPPMPQQQMPPPEVIAQMMAAQQGGQQPMMPQQGPDMAQLQAMSGQPPQPSLDQLAGTPPVGNPMLEPGMMP